MAELLKGYPKPLKDVVKIVRHEDHVKADTADEPPSGLDELPKYLRHAVAHFNIRPQSEDNQNLTHLLIWNRRPDNLSRHAGKINFVAYVNIRGLRDLAHHILKALAKTGVADRYEGIDPIKEFDAYWNQSPPAT